MALLFDDAYRDHRASNPEDELNHQYTLNVIWAKNLGYVLHPSIHPAIPQNKRPRILDVGAGAGYWLHSLGLELESGHASVEVEVEVESAGPPRLFQHAQQYQYFPAPKTHFAAALKAVEVCPRLPEMERDLCGYPPYVVNALHGFPRWLYGTFDVVHLRMLQNELSVEECSTMLRNAIGMLVPGGYIQWDEPDLSAIPGRWAQHIKNMGPLRRLLGAYTSAIGIQRLSVSTELPRLFREAGLMDIRAHSGRLDRLKETRQSLTHATRSAMFKTLQYQGTLDSRTLEDMWRESGESEEKGAYYEMIVNVVVGRKAKLSESTEEAGGQGSAKKVGEHGSASKGGEQASASKAGGQASAS